MDKRKLIAALSVVFFSFASLTVMAVTPSAEWEECARQAQNGDAGAQYRMGMMYRSGEIVDRNEKEAVYWFRKAASNGNGDAMLEVGRSFRDGLGVIPDERIAAENFWRAAEKGNPEGAYNYAEMLRDGKGVEQDKGKAYVW
ncbi:MAG: sel1 repeat family protein, partial [Muribaculaceae bacterium]|nr:sel1 repeat family protein [Muribaculaceae bacterium]